MHGRVPMGRSFVFAAALVALVSAPASAGSPDAVVGLPAWDRVPSPNGGGTSSELRGVQTFSPSNVWVVGRTGNQTLTERWNGASFSVVPSPSIAGRANILEDVDGVAPDDMWAVGHADSTSFVGSLSLMSAYFGGTPAQRWRDLRCCATATRR